LFLIDLPSLKKRLNKIIIITNWEMVRRDHGFARGGWNGVREFLSIIGDEGTMEKNGMGWLKWWKGE
jgi:hypothetical protein